MGAKPAAGNAGIVAQLAIERHWPGVPEPGVVRCMIV